MDGGIATVVGAVIAAVSSIAVAIYESRRRRAVQKELASAQKQLHAALVDKYGLEVKRAISRAEIRDLQGNERMSLTWEGVSAGDGKEFDAIPGKIWAGAPAAKVLDPELTYSFARAVRLETNRHSDKVCAYAVEIPGRLSSGDGELTYTVTCDVERGCLMTREEVNEAYAGDPLPFEYHIFDVAFPTVELVIEVIFPEAYQPRPFVAALYGGTEFSHRAEFQRLAKALVVQDNVARLRVEYPLAGFRYGIYWESPSKNALPKVIAQTSPVSDGGKQNV